MFGTRDPFYLTHPRLALFLTLAAALLSSAALPSLHVDLGLEQLLPTGDPELRRYRELGAQFGRDDNDVYVFFRHPVLWTPEGAADVIALSHALAASPLVARVVSLASAPLISRPYGLPRVEPVFASERLRSTAYGPLRARVLGEPLYRGRLISADGTTTALVAHLTDAARADLHRSEVVAHVSAAVAPFRERGFELLVTGNAPARDAYSRLVRRDAMVALPAATAVLALALALLFRCWVAVIAPLVAIGCAQLLTGAFLVQSGRPITMLSIAIPVILTVAGSSDSVHLMVRCRQGLAAGWSTPIALRDALLGTRTALRLTSVTTALGFFTLTVTGIPLLADFGVVTGFGVLAAYFTTMGTVPPLLVLFPRLRARGADRTGLLAALGTTVARQPARWLVAGGLGLAILGGLGIPRVRVEAQVIDDVPPTHPIRRTRDRVGELMGGNFPMSLVVHAGGGSPTTSPDLLRAVAAFQHSLVSDSRDILSTTVSAADVYSLVWRGLGGRGDLPETAEQMAALDRLIGDQVAPFLDRERGILRIEARLRDHGTAATLAFVERAQRLFESTVGDRARLEPQGFVYLAHKVHRRVVADALTGFSLSFAVITLLVLWHTRSFRLALLAVVANVIPPFVTLAFMGLAGIDLRLSSAVVFSIVFGLAVDDTLHFLARYQEERADSAQAAVLATTTTAGGAMVATSVILVAGFLTLTLTQFCPARDLGVLMAVSLTAALVADLVVLPALLILCHGRGPEPGPRFPSM